MGFFSTKRLVSVASSTSNLLADTPDVVHDAIVASIIQDDADNMVDSIIDSLAGGAAIKIRNAVAWAAVPGNYTLGLPQGSMEIGKGPDTLVIPILQAIENTTVSLVYNAYDDADPFMLALDHLSTVRGLDRTTNVVTDPPVPVGSQVLFISAVFSDSPEFIKIRYSYVENNVTKYLTEQLYFPGLDPLAIYFHVAYVTVDPLTQVVTSKIKYWNYKAGDMTYPELAVIPPVASSPYYPIVPLRRHNVDLTDPVTQAGEPLFDTSSRFMKMMGFDLSTIGTTISENPGIADIDHAYIIFGVDLFSDTEAGLTYLHDYFSYLAGISEYTLEDYNTWQADTSIRPKINIQRIQDDQLSTKIGYLYSDVQTVAGSIGSVGTVTRTVGNLDPYQYTVDVTEVDEAGNEYTITLIIYEVENSTLTFRKQIGPNTYSEVTVKGLLHVNYVYNGHVVETTVAMSQDPKEQNFIIPLNRLVVRGMPLVVENALMYEAMKILFNSYEITKVEWYETEEFGMLLKAVAIVITVLSLGTQSWTYAAAAAIATSAAVIFLIQLIIVIVVGKILAKLFTLIVRELGIDNALALLAIAVVATIASGNSEFLSAYLPSVDSLLFVISSFQTGIAGASQEEIEDLMTEAEEYSVEQEARRSELEELIEELLPQSNAENGLNVDLFKTEPVIFFPQESPEDFYERTMYTQNPGILAIDAVYNFVEYKLELPNAFDENMAGLNYG